MSFRICLAAVFMLACGPASAAWFNVPSAPKAPAAPKAASKGRPSPAKAAKPPMQFYVVKGAPDSCGRGCDRWIAAEGQIDSAAAARFRKFFLKLRDRNMPLYFLSPGGNVDQAVAMGTLLHEKPVIARVGRTTVSECGFEAQDGEACTKLKLSGRELNGLVSTRGALCGSACPYLMLGASRREVAPDAALAVHSARVVVTFTGGTPTPTMIAAANVRAHERSDRTIAAYFAKMGADAGLLALARTVKFEDMHVLTREEIVRFGFDRREFVETPWIFEPGTHGMVRKIAVQRLEGETSFRTIQWRMICFDSDRFELDFQRPTPANAAFSTVSISTGGAKPLGFTYPPLKASGVEQWGLRLAKASLQPLLGLPQAEFTETLLTADGRQTPRTENLSSEGLAGALDSLLGTCPAAKTATAPQAVGAREQAAK